MPLIFSHDSVARHGINDGFDIGKRDGFMRHDQQGDGIAQNLFDGVLPIFVGRAALFFVLGDFDDFQENIDHVFDLPAAGIGRAGKFIIQKTECLPTEFDEILFASFFPCIADPGITFIGFGTKDDAAISEFKVTHGDAPQRTG